MGATKSGSFGNCQLLETRNERNHDEPDSNVPGDLKRPLGDGPVREEILVVADSAVLQPRGVRSQRIGQADLVDHPRYRIVRVIGSGGMGAVYRVEHVQIDRFV